MQKDRSKPRTCGGTKGGIEKKILLENWPVELWGDPKLETEELTSKVSGHFLLKEDGKKVANVVVKAGAGLSQTYGGLGDDSAIPMPRTAYKEHIAQIDIGLRHTDQISTQHS